MVFMELSSFQELHIIIFTKFALLEFYLKSNFPHSNTHGQVARDLYKEDEAELNVMTLMSAQILNKLYRYVILELTQDNLCYSLTLAYSVLVPVQNAWFPGQCCIRRI